MLKQSKITLLFLLSIIALKSKACDQDKNWKRYIEEKLSILKLTDGVDIETIGIDDNRKEKLLRYGRGLSLEQSFKKGKIDIRLHCSVLQNANQSHLLQCCRLLFDQNRYKSEVPLGYTLDGVRNAVRDHFIWQPWVVKKVTGSECLIQERYLELQKLFPDDQKENRMRLLRYIVLSNLPLRLIDVDVENDINELKKASMNRRQVAQQASTETNGVPVKLDQESQELVDYMSQRWLLNQYQKIHDADAEIVPSNGRVTELSAE